MGGSETLRVVFDCNVLVQAAANPNGPASACLEHVRRGRLRLIMHPDIITEFTSVTSRPKVIAKLRFQPETVKKFVEDLLVHAENVLNVAQAFVHPADPKDGIYVNLAVAANASIITSCDLHLLNLVDPERSESFEFRKRFPGIEIITPVQLLDRVKQE